MSACINRTSLAVWIALSLALGARAAETPRAGPAAAIVLPPPRAELPPLPADGSGIRRLHLEDGYPGAANCRPHLCQPNFDRTRRTRWHSSDWVIGHVQQERRGIR
jgi:hypothetical protein